MTFRRAYVSMQLPTVPGHVTDFLTAYTATESAMPSSCCHAFIKVFHVT